MYAGIAPPPLLTESQMPVKTLPCPNFVAGGNKFLVRDIHLLLHKILFQQLNSLHKK